MGALKDRLHPYASDYIKRPRLNFHQGPNFFYGKRPDGTYKGPGWLGRVDMLGNDNRFMTELSTGVELNGRETLIPTLVPGLSGSELLYLRLGGDPRRYPAIMSKAVGHARKMMATGRSAFYNEPWTK